MKKLFIFMLILLLHQSLFAADIEHVEYFIDTDPGRGSAIEASVTSGMDVTADFDVDISGLDGGHHILYIRAMDGEGKWSLDLARPFMMVEGIDSDTLPDVVKAEYFFDADPGFGLGTDISLERDIDVTPQFTVDLSSLSVGHHMLYIRTQDERGNWSHSLAKPLLVVERIKTDPFSDMVKAEYFVDIDPGFDNGSPVAIAASPDATAEFTVDLTNIDLGHHILYFRAQDSRGNWSLTLARPFYKLKALSGEPVNRVEYFIDTDPGYGLATAIPISPGTRLNLDFTVDLTGLSLGEHTLFVRARNTSGDWSLIHAAAFTAVSDFTLTGASPATVDNSGQATIAMNGPVFTQATEVKLTGPGGDILPVNTVQVSGTSIHVTFDLTGIQPGSYDIQVLDDEGNIVSTLENGVTVAQGGKTGHITVEAVPPEFVRPSRKYTCWIEYENDGGTDISAPLLIVSNNADAPMRLSKDEPFQTGSVQILAVNFEGPAGILPPGCQNRIPVYFQMPSSSSDTIEFTVEKLTADTTPVDWESIEADLKPEDVDEDAWSTIWANFKAQMGDSWAEYQATLDADATYLSIYRRSMESSLVASDLTVVETGNQALYDVRSLLQFEMSKAGNGIAPRSALSSSQDLFAPAPGLPLTFGRFSPISIEARFRIGPFGRGWTHTYEYKAEEQDDGDIHIIGPGGTLRIFQWINNVYQPLAGDYGQLSKDGNDLVLREKGGMQWTYDIDGALSEIEDLNGNTLTFSYSADGLSAIAHSNGDAISIEYSGGRISRAAGPLGREVQYRYDDAGEHLIEVEAPDSVITGYEYHEEDGSAAAHALEKISLPELPDYRFQWDDRGRLGKEWTDGDSTLIFYTYEAPGSIKMTDAAGNHSTVRYGASGEVLETVNPLGSIIKSSFDGKSQTPLITGPNGKAVAIAYDGNGNPTGIKNALDQLVKLAYDDESRLTRLTDARSNTTEFSYDDQGNMTGITYPDAGAEFFAYDNEGNITTYTNRRSQPVSYVYNFRGQMSQKNYPDGRNIVYTYDAKGRLISANDSQTGIISMQYNDRDLMTRIEYPGGYWFTFEYNDANQRTRRTGHDGHLLDYAYDDTGRLQSITDGSGTELINYTYDENGRLKQEDKGNGTRTTYDYDAAGQLLHMINYSPGGVVQSRFDYTYDDIGNRTTMTTLDGKTEYRYDDIGQLVGVTYPDGKITTYEYDEAGNRVSVVNDGSVTNYTTNNMNQYTQAGDASYEYDADGNMTGQTDAEGETTYTYDAENRLICVETPAKGVWTYTYDALGNRISVDHDGDVTRYVHDPVGLVDVAAEYNGTGDLIARYTHGFGLISRADASGSSAYYAFDGIGHTRQMTDGGGTVVNRYDYSPFGIVLQSDEVVENMFQYVGRFGVIAEGHELNYMRARYYLASITAFMSTDPISLSSSYSFANNNPLLYTDPQGLKPERLTVKLQVRPLNSPVGGALFGIHNRVGHYQFFYEENGIEKNEGLIRDDNNEPFNIIEDPSDADLQKQYQTVMVLDVDAELFHKAIELTEQWYSDAGFNYGILAHSELNVTHSKNCITFAYDVIQKYIELNNGNLTVVSSEKSRILRAIDPNEKVAPAGVGDAHYIIAGQKLDYTIYFENKSTAQAPAQEVFINDYLDEDLDWSTFKLGDVSFGDHVDTRLKGKTNDEIRVLLDDGMVVHIEAQIVEATGLVQWTFRTLDPETGELPEDVFAGFLPPEDGNGAGQGYVTFTIHAKETLAKETEITNAATIVFDTEAPIETNTVLNTITDDVPAPSETPQIADGETGVTISAVLQWSASDYATAYDLYLWEDGETKPSTPTAENLTSPFYDASRELNYNTTYNWQIVAKNVMGSSAGPVWQFRTIEVKKGDLNFDKEVNLLDVILGLQILAGIDITPDFREPADVDTDHRIGMAEIIHDLQVAAEIQAD